MIAFYTVFPWTIFSGMAIFPWFSEFTGTGVTWERGFLETFSEVLMGGLGMGEHDHLAAAAASTSATAPMVLKDPQNTKDDYHLPSRLGGSINSTSPLPLSVSINTDAATTTILTTTTTNGAKAGQGHGWGVRGYAQDGLGDSWNRPLAAAADHPYTHVAVVLISAMVHFLIFLCFVRAVRFARFIRSVRSFRFKDINWRYLKEESWFWLRLVCLAPFVFFHHLWLHTLAEFYHDDDWGVKLVGVDEAYAKTAYIYTTVGGMRPISVYPELEQSSVEGSVPRKPEGGRLAGHAPRPSGRPPSAFGQKPKSLAPRQRTWKTALTKFHASILKLTAIPVWLWGLLFAIFRFLVEFVGRIRMTRVTLRPFTVRVRPAVPDSKDIDPDLLDSDNDSKGKKGNNSGNKSNKGKKNAGNNAGGKGGSKKGKGRQR